MSSSENQNFGRGENKSKFDVPLVRIVDDDEALRGSLEFMLTCEGYETASYPSAAAFLIADMPSRPGCVVLDVMMPNMTGLELQEEMNRRGIDLPVIFLTAHGTIDMAVETMRAGAWDFQQKPIQAERFLQAIARAVEKDRLRREGARDDREERRLYDSLTDREKEIGRLVGQGFINKVIAERLGISKRTVDHIRAAALTKLGLHSVAELAGFFERMESQGS